MYQPKKKGSTAVARFKSIFIRVQYTLLGAFIYILAYLDNNLMVLNILLKLLRIVCNIKNHYQNLRVSKSKLIHFLRICHQIILN